MVDGRLEIRLDGVDRDFHPRWLLDRSVEAPEVDPTSRQRFFEPADVSNELAITEVWLDPTGTIHVGFDDGRSLRTTHEQLSTWIGPDPEAPPAARPWSSLGALPTIGWDEVGHDDAFGRSSGRFTPSVSS